MAEFEGELDLATANAIDDATAGAIERGAGALVLDLGDVTFIDSTAVSALFRAARLCAERDIRLALATENDAVLRTMALVELERAVHVYATRASAEAAVRNGA